MKYLSSAIFVMLISPALAQEAAQGSIAAVVQAPPVQVTAPVTPPAPAPQITQAPATAAPMPVASNIPQLPPSKPCARPNVDGLWKLKSVYEDPPGHEASGFARQPEQYILYFRDDTFNTYRNTWADQKPQAIANEMRVEYPTKLQQFLVHESGIVFFYIDGKISDTQACFIVANQAGSFEPGQMLLMPPEGTIPGRLIKVYERIKVRLGNHGKEGDESVQQEDIAPPPSQVKKNKRKKNQNAQRRRRNRQHNGNFQ